MALKVQHAGTGEWIRLPLEDGEDAACSFRGAAVAISRRLELEKFSLHIHPRSVDSSDADEAASSAAFDEAAAAWDAEAAEAPLTHVTKAEWAELIEANAGGTLTLLAAPATPASPASWVDPFWACEGTDLPQLKGIAAAWYWPKALQGNAHPGALLPFDTVSVIPFSGAYPSGYGLNSGASGGKPELLRALVGDETPEQRAAMPPQQYTTVGFTHFQASGTGSIGNYMNYMKTMPLPMSGDEFIAGGKGLNQLRHTIVGERAEPGRYSCVIAESNTAAEVTTAPSVACHRYTARASWSEPVGGAPPAANPQAGIRKMMNFAFK